ncbi:MAG TPA: Holliday junction resolvase RuvX [Acidimicrobiia bacterium]
MSRSLGVDFGTTRVGLAISDPLGLTARPLSVVPRSVVLDEVVNLVKEQDIGTIVVGLPTGLSGGEGVSATEARKLAEEIRTVTGVDVVMVDERFTSRLAEVALLESGMKRRKRRETVDKVAAAIILQDYLDRSQ